MVLELYQQLGSAVRRHGAQDRDMPLTKKGTPLKGGYHNHPCTRWTGDSRQHYQWASEHALALATEYQYRYDKIHSCTQGILFLSNMDHFIPEGPLTPFAQAMPDIYKNDDAVYAYRSYYLYDKRKNIQCEWNKTRPAPTWFTDIRSVVKW